MAPPMRYEKIDRKTLKEIQKELRLLKRGRVPRKGVRVKSANEVIRMINGRSRLKKY